MRTPQPLANGFRTDHPVPDVPFVDDGHLPLDDPRGIEAMGRKRDTGMWGRCDKRAGGQWLAFTTDPVRHDLGWCVRYHPDHGWSVLVYRDEDASSVHMDWWGDPLLFRAGGYWWDGATWYRPAQVWDAAGETYDRRPVPAAVTVTAADLLDDTADPDQGRVVKIANFDAEADSATRWLDDLALWATRRTQRGERLPLADCVVKLSAPELAGDQLVGVAEMAETAGVSASTLRAYLSRGEADVPSPQATVGGRSVWARPVAQEWAEQRRRSPEHTAATVATHDNGAELPVGVADVQRHFTRLFFSELWEHPGRRKRWAVRHRTDEAVYQVAADLGWTVAASLEAIVPTDALTGTIRHAVLDELADGQHNERELGHIGRPAGGFYGITPAVARMLDWLVRHHPRQAHHIIGEIIGDAERRLNIPRDVTGHSLRTALQLDGQLPDNEREEYLDRVLPPTTSGT